MGTSGEEGRVGVIVLHTKTLIPLLMMAVAWLAAAGEAAKPLARWSFEHGTDQWRSLGGPIAWSKAKAHDGGWSLRLAVDFPHPSSVVRPVNVDVDLVGRIVYHVYVPADAPEGIKTLLFLKDKDGLWFQHFTEESLRPGAWNTVSVEIGPMSPHLRPSGHHHLWDSTSARRMNQLGVKFFCDERFTGFLHLDAVAAQRGAASNPPLRVLNLHENAQRVGRYEKLEVTFDLNRHVTNPFDPEQIKIDAIFFDPKGRKIVVPAFYYQGFVRRLQNDREELVPVGAGRWEVRFAPVVLGHYTYKLVVEHHPDRRAHGAPVRLVTGARGFECVDSDSRGFVRVSKKDPLYFEFDSGEWFYPIGHSVHSPSDDTPRAVKIQRAINAGVMPDRGTFTYDTLFKKMAAAGENFAEVWMCTWWLGLEWIKDWKHYDGLTSYNLHHAWKLDYLVDLAARHDLYLHLVIDNHGKASTWCDPEWEDNPYNQVNGGFLDSPEDFFRNPIAREIYKKKLRYIVARWGYSPRIAGLELWSEVDLVGDSWDFHADPAAALPKVRWHRDMAAYLDRIDPWGHLVTTHFSTTYQRIQESLVSIPGIDYIVCDAYKMTGGSILRLIFATARTFTKFGKPGMVTEYGGTPFGSSTRGLRADLHAGLWATYMTHTAGTPLLWWFQFIDSDDLYWNFKALAAYHAGEDRRGLGLVNRTATFPNPHHDLSAVCLQNTNTAYVWVYSRSAMERMPTPQLAPVFDGTSIRLRGIDAGAYRIEVWDTYKGAATATLEATARSGYLTVPLPAFRTDCALKVKPLAKPQAPSAKPQAASAKPQAAGAKPQAAGAKPPAAAGG